MADDDEDSSSYHISLPVISLAGVQGISYETPDARSSAPDGRGLEGEASAVGTTGGQYTCGP